MARLFNGTSDLINMGTGVNAPVAMTLSAWVKATTLTPAYSAVVSRIVAGGITQYYQLFIKSNGKLAVFVDATANVSYDGTGTNTLSTGTWFHVAFVYSSSVGLIGYVNGTVDNTAAANGGLITTSPGAFEIANDTNTSGRLLAGSVADVAQWNVVLTAAEITALAQGVRAFNVRPAALDGYWPLDGLQSPEPDLSGKANNGALTGTALAFGPPIAPFTPRWPQVLAPPAITEILMGQAWL